MFSGDEVGAIVVDVGSSITKAGYAGDDQPKAVFPSAIGVKYSNGKDNFIGEGAKGVGDEMDIEVSSSQQRYYVGSESLSFRRDNMEILYPCENGLNWDVVERLWSFAFYSRLKINPKEHPLFMVEPSFNTRQNREKLTEIAFEKYETPALFVAKDAVLSCFAAGRATGLVVDSGGGKTSVVPIYDGYALQQAIVKTNIGGDKLDKELLRILSAKYPKMAIFPSYQVNKRDIGGGKYKVAIHDFPLTHPSYSRYMINNVVADIRHSVCQVHDGPFDPYHTTVSSNSYEFPDGNVIEIGIERISIPELLFSSDPKITNEVEKPVIPIQKMIYQSITLCDPEIRKEFITGIIVNGGNTLYNGFYERLSTELSPLMTPKAKVVINTPIERKYGAWIGGSIMASLGSFHQLWMSKSEYEERGKSLVERKCP